MDAELPLVAVLISTYRREDALLRCLESLRNQSYPPDRLNVTVFNDAGPDGVAARISAWNQSLRPAFAGFRFIDNPGGNLQIAAVRQCLTREAPREGAYFLYLDDDAVLDEYCVGTLVKYLQSDPRSGAAGPKILSLDHPDQTVHGANFINPWTGRYSERDSPEPIPCDWLNSTCLMARRSAAEKVEGFWEGFFTAHEEVDYCLQIRRAGFEVSFVPQAKAYHAIDFSRPKRERFYYLYRNKILLIRRQFVGIRRITALLTAVLMGLPRYLVESISHNGLSRPGEFMLIIGAVWDGLLGRSGARRGLHG